MKKEQTSDVVKREIFEELSEEPRFNHVLQNVIDNIKKGQVPVVIESWKTYFRKMKPHDELWNILFTERESEQMLMRWDDDSVTFDARVSLNAKLDKPFREANITVAVSRNKRDLLKKTLNAPEQLLKSMVYFGHRDQNYFKLYFTQLGYSVKEGNVADKYGLLISLGE